MTIADKICTITNDYENKEDLRNNFIDYLIELNDNNYLKRLSIRENRITIEINKKRRLRIQIYNDFAFGFGNKLNITNEFIILDKVFFDKEKITDCCMTLTK